MWLLRAFTFFLFSKFSINPLFLLRALKGEQQFVTSMTDNVLAYQTSNHENVQNAESDISDTRHAGNATVMSVVPLHKYAIEILEDAFAR